MDVEDHALLFSFRFVEVPGGIDVGEGVLAAIISDAALDSASVADESSPDKSTVMLKRSEVEELAADPRLISVVIVIISTQGNCST